MFHDDSPIRKIDMIRDLAIDGTLIIPQTGKTE